MIDNEEKDKQEIIEFLNEVEDRLTDIRQRIRYRFPNYNSLPKVDALMMNMIKTNILLSHLQDSVRIDE